MTSEAAESAQTASVEDPTSAESPESDSGNALFSEELVQQYSSESPEFQTDASFSWFGGEAYWESANVTRSRKLVGETKLKSGQSFFTILQQWGVDSKKILAMTEVCRESYNVEKLPADVRIRLYEEGLEGSHSDHLLVEIVLNDLETLLIREQNNTFDVELVEVEKTLKNNGYRGIVAGNLWESALTSGLAPTVAGQLSQILAVHLDNGRRVHRGDQWQVVIEEYWNQDKKLGFGNIIAASYLELGAQKPLRLFRYEPGDAPPGYYHEDGTSLDRLFQDSPLPGSRITSGFSSRFHPILKIVRPHLGVDYAAPIGSPIRAVGDGKVVQMGTQSDLGKMIRIRHSMDFETVYGHLKGFHKGLRVGSVIRKGQVIGYVGMTGLTTGPHLHFSMLQNKKYVNPLKIVVPRKDNLSGEELEKFSDHVSYLSGKFGSLSVL